ncbi:MAG TPA: MBL fold metallo-hydrolase [Thermoanaerobaculia bacterium]|jgi:ribonuclease Z|nr:MBL fold metallo-hydrolase [Thermoanaerobaculia bacterium]
MRPVELRFGDLRIEGWSRAGDDNWFRVHPPGLALDVGRGALQLAGAQDVFLSHGHLDHAMGLPFVLSQRSLHRLVHTRVFCPVEMAEPLGAFIAAAERMEHARYRYEILPLAAGDRVEVGRGLHVEAFATDHVVPTLGYHLWRGRRRLAPAFAGFPREELIALRERGVETSEVAEDLWLSYCADTGPAIFEREPRIFGSRVLMMECTFLGEEHRDKGERFKHLHLGDIAQREEEFRNEAIVLHHLSRRFRVEDLRAEVNRRLPELAARIHILVEGTAG